MSSKQNIFLMFPELTFLGYMQLGQWGMEAAPKGGFLTLPCWRSASGKREGPERVFGVRSHLNGCWNGQRHPGVARRL